MRSNYFLSEAFESPPTFVDRHIKVPHPLYGAKSLDVHDYQREFINKINIHNRLICLSARDMMTTETALATLVWNLNYIPNMTIVISAIHHNQLMDNFAMFKKMHALLPESIKCPVTIPHQRQLHLANNSRILAIDNINLLCDLKGTVVDLIYLDGFAHYNNPSTMLNTAIIHIPRIIITSTTVPLNSEFAAVWNGAVNNANGFEDVEYVWSDHPHKDSVFETRMRQQLGDYVFDTEYNNVFT